MCLGQWMVDGDYQPMFNLYRGDLQDFSDDDDDAVNDEGPIFTSTGNAYDYYTYYPGYYDADIGLHAVGPCVFSLFRSLFRSLSLPLAQRELTKLPRQLQL